MLGDPMSTHGALFIAQDTVGIIQIQIDIMKNTLQANGISVTSQIEDEISLYFKTQHEEYARELCSKGVPEKLQVLLTHTKKSKLVAYSKRITISERDLFFLVHNCDQIGYTHKSKFPEYVPKNRKISKKDLTSKTNEPKKFFGKIRAIFKERKNYMIHLFENDDIWHCIYYTYHEMEADNNQWKYGPHLHFVNYLWPEYTKRRVWVAFDKRDHKINGVHIKLEPLPTPAPQADPEFRELAKAFIRKYKNA